MKNAITCTKNIAIAPYLPNAAYKSALALATEHKGKIGKTDKGNFMATFSSAKVAKKFVAEWTAEYEAHRKPAPAPKPAQKPKASKPTDKKVTPSSPKKTAPRKTKGNAFDYSVIKGETKSDKNRALHAMLVGMGIADSRTKEYQAVWTARPWAK